MYQLINYNGMLAIASPWITSFFAPKEKRVVYVSDNFWIEGYYSQFTELVYRSGKKFVALSNRVNTTQMFDVDGWASVIERRDIAQPDQGKDKWVWFRGAWVSNEN